MRSMFEYMATVIIMMIVTFVFISFFSIEIQEISARNYHSRIVERIQYAGDYANANPNNYAGDFSFSLQNDNSLKVTYRYNIETPFLKTIMKREVVGFAR